MSQITCTYRCPECEHEFDFKFTPARPAPACSNPDSPAFSDSGDGAETDAQFEDCPKCGREITDDELLDQAEKQSESHFAEMSAAEIRADHQRDEEINKLGRL